MLSEGYAKQFKKMQPAAVYIFSPEESDANCNKNFCAQNQCYSFFY